jgi:curved DNA-binding protein CbpA
MAVNKKKVEYYSVLEVWPKSSEEEIKKNYFRLAKLYHPDVAGDRPENKERFKLINEAYSVLGDPQKRRLYDESIRSKGGATKEGQELLKEDGRSASMAFRQARDAMRVGRYDKAIMLLRTAIRFDGSDPAYHSWYGFCLAMTNSDLHEARDACRKAIEIEFYSADFHANLGFVYFKAGLKNLAVKHFTEALKWDADHSLARKVMAQLDGGNSRYGESGPIDKLVSGFKKIFVG